MAALDLIDQLRVAVPEEVRAAKRINSEGERIIEKAQEEAERIVARAQEQAAFLIDERGLTQAAEDESRRIIGEAEADGDEIRRGADEYAASVLIGLEGDVVRTLQSIKKGIDLLDERGPTLRAEDDAPATSATIRRVDAGGGDGVPPGATDGDLTACPVRPAIRSPGLSRRPPRRGPGATRDLPGRRGHDRPRRRPPPGRPVEGTCPSRRTNRGAPRAAAASGRASRRVCSRCLRASRSRSTLEIDEEALPSIDIATGQPLDTPPSPTSSGSPTTTSSTSSRSSARRSSWPSRSRRSAGRTARACADCGLELASGRPRPPGRGHRPATGGARGRSAPSSDRMTAGRESTTKLARRPPPVSSRSRAHEPGRPRRARHQRARPPEPRSRKEPRTPWVSPSDASRTPGRASGASHLALSAAAPRRVPALPRAEAPHHVCPNCGYYNGRQAIELKKTADEHRPPEAGPPRSRPDLTPASAGRTRGPERRPARRGRASGPRRGRRDGRRPRPRRGRARRPRLRPRRTPTTRSSWSATSRIRDRGIGGGLAGQRRLVQAAGQVVGHGRASGDGPPREAGRVHPRRACASCATARPTRSSRPATPAPGWPRRSSASAPARASTGRPSPSR